MSIDINVSNNIATIELDVPPVNAFDSSQWFDLSKSIDELSFSNDARVIVIRAQGKGFCAGVDIKELQSDSSKIHAVNDGCWKVARAIHVLSLIHI